MKKNRPTKAVGRIDPGEAHTKSYHYYNVYYGSLILQNKCKDELNFTSYQTRSYRIKKDAMADCESAAKKLGWDVRWEK